MDFAYALGFWAKYAYVDSAVLGAASRLGVFANLPLAGEGFLELGELAARLGASARGTRVLVEPLVATGVLAREAGGLALGRPVAGHLRDPSFVEALDRAVAWWDAAGQLAQAVRTGQPVTAAGRSWDLLGHYRELFPAAAVPDGAADPAGAPHDRAARNFLRTAALIAAADIGLLEPSGDAPICPAELAAERGLAPEGLAVLLQTLVHLGVLEAAGAAYRRTPAAADYLERSGRAAFGQGLAITSAFWDALGRLDVSVRRDERTMDLADPAQSGPFYLALARYNTSAFPAYYGLIRQVPATVRRIRPLEGAAILDVGAGSGVWGIAFGAAEPTARMTFLDQAPVLAQTRKNVARLQLSDRAEFWPADLLGVDYGAARFDVILLGQICHTQERFELPKLLGKLVQALRPGGCIVLADFVLNERRDAPLDYLYFAVKEFVATQGDILSLAEYADLLRGAGLPNLRCYHLPGIDVFLANRGGGALPDELVPRAALAAAGRPAVA
jgi:precorrin-6B methylase 2